jgi:hypothetical protein
MFNILAIMEMQIKTMLRFTFLLEWLPSKAQTTTNVSKDVEKKESSYTAGGNVNYYNHLENCMEAPQNTKNRTAI